MQRRADDVDAKGDAAAADRQRGVADDEEFLDGVFPDHPGRAGGRGRRPVYAVIPEEIIKSPPEEFSAFLESIFAEDRDLEEALERFLQPSSEVDESNEEGSSGSVHAVVPIELLRSEGADPAEFLEQVYEAFEEIDDALKVLHDRRLRRGDASTDSTTAVVPDHLIADPEELTIAIDRARDEATKLQLLFRQARHTLRRLDLYRLSNKSPGQVIEEMRRANELRTLQYLVDFLRSIHSAAESFEKLELPKVHIRDYLTHLYLMKDWQAMRQLVELLQASVLKYVREGVEARDAEEPVED